MCNVNYLIEIRRFNTFAARTRLPASAQLLWYKLIEIMNQHARGGDWCDGFLRIDNPYLLAYFPMSATALADARRTLCEAGLLEYIPGEKKRTPPAYRLHYFSVCDGKGAVERDYPREISADSTADCPADDPEIRDYPRDNPNYPSVYPSDCTTVCPTDCTTDCHGNTPDFHDTNINYTETETETVNPTGKTNDDEKETSAFSAGYAGAGACTGAYACTDAGAREGAFPRSVRESAKLAGKVLLHQVFTENQLNRVMAAFNRYPFEDGLMIQAVAKTAEANPTNAVNYLIQLLTDWGGVKGMSNEQLRATGFPAPLGCKKRPAGVGRSRAKGWLYELAGCNRRFNGISGAHSSLSGLHLFNHLQHALCAIGGRGVFDGGGQFVALRPRLH